MKDFILPDIGEGIVECEIVTWRVAEGDYVNEDQPVCDVMTDKALVEIPSIYSGKITKLYHPKGGMAKVHEPLFAINIDDGAVDEIIDSMDACKQDDRSKKAPGSLLSKAASNSKQGMDVDGNASVSPDSSFKNNVITGIPSIDPPQRNKKAISSPSVRRLARELNINLSDIHGSGEKGRIYKEDLWAINCTTQNVQLDKPVQHEEKKSGVVRAEPICGVMAAMAKHMTASVSTIPHFTFCEEINITSLIKLRIKMNERYEKQNIKLSMMSFFIKTLSMALNKFPQINVQTNAQCSQLFYHEDHNIGMAVDSGIGLLVPNIKQCQHKSILGIDHEVIRLTQDARDGHVKQQDLKGGTITISNIGALGGTVATPVINSPEAAIVAIGRIQTLPRFNVQGEVEARQVVQISWSADHRIIDGATIARFNNLWKEYLENPGSMLCELV